MKNFEQDLNSKSPKVFKIFELFLFFVLRFRLEWSFKDHLLPNAVDRDVIRVILMAMKFRA